jgi:hypothetical protein
MKKISGAKMFRNHPKNSFSYLGVGKTTSRWFFFGEKLKNQNFAFFEIVLKIFFKNACSNT